MQRNLHQFVASTYDLIIVGGGIAGAFAAWDAALRGLTVALVEKGDFGAATSAASGKVIHGGIRYLQYGALHRVRESLHERMVFQRIAPQFVDPIPFLIPTYGHFLKGKEILKLGMMVYDALALDKSDFPDPGKIIPRHRVLSRREVLNLEPGINSKGLTGGVCYYDCQMHNPERLTLSILLAADVAGANLANYSEVTDFIQMSNRMVGVIIRDAMTGGEFEIKGKVILNAAGPWVGTLLSSLKLSTDYFRSRYSKGIHIVTRPITRNYAIALASRHRSVETMLQRGGRHFFVIPWRNHSLIGTTNVPFGGDLDEKMVTENDILGLLEGVNAVYPAGNLKREDIVYQYGGLYLDNEKRSFEDGYQGGRKDQILDHSKLDGIEGLVTLICVKYTTARKLAQRTIDLVFKKLGYKPPQCRTEATHIYGGGIPQFKEFLARETTKQADILKEEVTRNLICNYGNCYSELFDYLTEAYDSCERVLEKFPVIKAQVIHAVRKEMAQKLVDIVFRRTGLGTLGNPGEKSLQICASIMARELGWGKQRIQKELIEVREAFRPN